MPAPKAALDAPRISASSRGECRLTSSKGLDNLGGQSSYSSIRLFRAVLTTLGIGRRRRQRTPDPRTPLTTRPTDRPPATLHNSRSSAPSLSYACQLLQRPPPMGDTESEDRVEKLAMSGPSINEVMHLRGEGVGQNVKMALIGCMNGTVTGGGGPKCEVV